MGYPRRVTYFRIVCTGQTSLTTLLLPDLARACLIIEDDDLAASDVSAATSVYLLQVITPPVILVLALAMSTTFLPYNTMRVFVCVCAKNSFGGPRDRIGYFRCAII